MIECFLTLQQVREYIRLVFQITKIPLAIQTIRIPTESQQKEISFPDIPEMNLLKLPETIEEKLYSMVSSTDINTVISDTPLCYTEEDVYTAFYVPFTILDQEKKLNSKMLLSIGPCFQKQMNRGFSRPDIWKNRKTGCFRDCTDEESLLVSQHIPYWNIPHLCAVVQLLYVLLFKIPIHVSDILNPSSSFLTDVDAMTTEELFERRENNAFHSMYTQESKIWKIIENGQTDKITEAFTIMLFSSTGKLAKSRLRHEKNMAICTTTLATRAAILGGVPDEIAYTMSDSFIQKIEEMTTPENIILFNKKIIADFTKAAAEYKHKDRKNYSPVVNISIQYIEQHLHDKITLEGISDRVNLSISQISRKFKKETGISIVDFFQKQKIEAACNMLKYSERSLLEISNIFSFSSQSYFSAVFRKYTGKSPSEYRLKAPAPE
jgi:AraC-like DNA-binding protein